MTEHPDEDVAQLIGLLPVRDVEHDADRAERPPVGRRVGRREVGPAVGRDPADAAVGPEHPVLVVERPVALGRLGGREAGERLGPIVGVDARILGDRRLVGPEDPVELGRPVHPAALEVVVVHPEPAHLGRDPEPLLAGPAGLLGHLPLRDVDPDAVELRRPAVLVDRTAPALHPAPRSIGVPEPELDDVITAALDRPGDRDPDRRPVVGMNEREKDALVTREGLGRQPEQLLELGAPGHLLGRQVALPPAHPSAAHRQGERRLGAAQALLGVADVVDVGRGAVPQGRIPTR